MPPHLLYDQVDLERYTLCAGALQAQAVEANTPKLLGWLVRRSDSEVGGRWFMTCGSMLIIVVEVVDKRALCPVTVSSLALY
jgi:hypothetical protein